MGSISILDKIKEADMVLVGLGEEFDGAALPGQDAGYGKGCGLLDEAGLSWLIPAWNAFYVRKSGEGSCGRALKKLSALLEGKNYFIVSVSTNSEIAGFDRTVMPCGSILRKQCGEGCAGVLEEVTDRDREWMEACFMELAESGAVCAEGGLGVCPVCGAPLVLNHVYAEHYNEAGYQEQWELYKKWLQGTLNRRLLVLELGVGMRFPSVIRWPFEKAAYFNRKAYFYRVNDKLYQLTKELAGKGCGIAQNAIDWLAQL